MKRLYHLDLSDALRCACCGRTGPGEYLIIAQEIPDGATTILLPDRVVCADCGAAKQEAAS